MELKDLRVMVIGAHPDDADLNCGGTAAMYAKAGARVRFVSVCNGDKGHLTMDCAALATRRAGETQNSAKTLGIERYTVMGAPDCEIEPTLEWRRKITCIIREFEPHIIFTHRTCDYHADHRAVAQLVMDATYLLVVPHYCQEVPEPKVYPAVFFMRDKFTVPRLMRPDVAVETKGVIDQWADAISCHVSQMYEWLPREIPGCLEANPGPDAPVEVRREYIKRFWAERKLFDARRYGLQMEYPEIFEMSEYGKQLSSDELKQYFPAGAYIPERSVDKQKS